MDFLPAVDPMPLPAPYWLFKLLLLVTFILHILAMNIMFGGGVIAAVARFKGKKDEKYLRLAKETAKKIPSFMAATITLGIAPLLFLQVLYGQFFYTSSVIIGWPWLLVLVFLTLAYYGFYLTTFKEKSGGVTSWISVGSLILIFLIGFIYSTNITLMLTPEKWADKYFADPSGWNLNWQDTTLLPRFLHFITAALAIGGFLLVITGLIRWRKEQDYAKFLIVHGGKWFMYPTMIQVLIGLWYLISLPRDQMMLFMGGNILGTISLMIGFLGSLVVIYFMTNAIKEADPRKGAITTMGLTAVIVIFMAIMRDIIRDASLASYFDPGKLVVKIQWDVLILFLVLLIAGVLLWLWMLKRYFSAPASDLVK